MAEMKEDQSSKKFDRYIASIFKSESFLATVATMRERYDIPKGGFNMDEYESYEEVESKWSGFDNLEISQGLFDDVTELSEKYELHFIEGFQILYRYIFIGEIDYEKIFMGFNHCAINDSKEEIQDIFDDIKNKRIEHSISTLGSRTYPISISISPYATQRDVLDFVSKNFKSHIEPIQEKYKIPNSKKSVRTRTERKDPVSKKDLYDLVYKNRDLDWRAINDKVYEKYGELLDYNAINQIIQTETKRRT